MTHDEHMLTPDQVRDRVASAATRTVEPGRVSVLERLQQERDTSARLADQVNEMGEELADLREENAGLKVENQELRARLERETPARHEDRDLLEAHLALVERVRDLHHRIDIAEGEITSLIHDPDANGETRVDGIARTVDELADRIQALEGEAA